LNKINASVNDLKNRFDEFQQSSSDYEYTNIDIDIPFKTIEEVEDF
jgi:hypothetical protein